VRDKKRLQELKKVLCWENLHPSPEGERCKKESGITRPGKKKIGSKLCLANRQNEPERKGRPDEQRGRGKGIEGMNRGVLGTSGERFDS